MKETTQQGTQYHLSLQDLHTFLKARSFEEQIKILTTHAEKNRQYIKWRNQTMETNKSKKQNMIKKVINEILAEKTGKNLATIEKDVDRDYYMSATEALEYGLVDKIIKNK